MSKNYYDIVGVSPYALRIDIRVAYVNLRKKVELEKRPGQPNPKLDELDKAFQVLIDPVQRAAYDSSRARASTGTSSGSFSTYREILTPEQQQRNKIHYEALRIPIGSSIEVVREAYQRLALLYHPDKHLHSDEATRNAAQEEFQKLERAHSVLLGNGDKRGNKRRATTSSDHEPPTSGAKRPGEKESSQFSHTWSTPTQFGSRYGEGSSSGAGGTAGGTGTTERAGSANQRASSERVFKFGNNESQSSSGNERASGERVFKFGNNESQSSSGNADTQNSTNVHNVFVSLEEIANGCQKEMHISREVKQPNGVIKTVETIEKITVKPGWKAGTKITFGKELYPGPNTALSDVVFVIRDMPHPDFERDGSNICHTAPISLKQALCAKNIDVPTLDGSQWPIDVINEIRKSDTVTKIEGKGLPFPKEPSRKGDLIVKFFIRFPKFLSNQAKNAIAQILPD